MKIEDLNLSGLKYFLDAVEFKSITQSAERNHVSRPAVSQAIVRLEEWCGQSLLVHEKRSFKLTPAGQNFYRLAKHNFDTLKTGFIENQTTDTSLRIGCSNSLIDLVFPKIQKIIHLSQHPTFKIGTTQSLLSLLEQDQIHIAILIEIQKNSKFNTVDIKSGCFELRSKTGKHTDILVTTEKRPEVEAYLRYMAKNKMKIIQHIEVESWSVAIRLADLMDATCLVPDYLPSGKFQQIKLKGWNFPYTAQAVIKKQSVLTQIESQLLQSFCP